MLGGRCYVVLGVILLCWLLARYVALGVLSWVLCCVTLGVRFYDVWGLMLYWVLFHVWVLC